MVIEVLWGGEERRALVKCTEWTLNQAIPVLRSAVSFSDVVRMVCSIGLGRQIYCVLMGYFSRDGLGAILAM